MVPSGIAPQFTAMYLPCFLCDKEWIIFGILSLPTPLSPVTNTEISVGATWMAFSTARFSFGSFPIIPNRCFVACMLSINSSPQRRGSPSIWRSLAEEPACAGDQSETSAAVGGLSGGRNSISHISGCVSKRSGRPLVPSPAPTIAMPRGSSVRPHANRLP